MQHLSISSPKDPTDVAPVPVSVWPEFVEWIDPLRDSSEVIKIVAELANRIASVPNAPPPLEAKKSEQRVAGAYVMMMGAKVASVGGVRAIDNHTGTAAHILEQLVADARNLGAVQIQAVVDAEDSALTEIIEVAGFAALSELQQMWLPIAAEKEDSRSVQVELATGLRWVQARDVPLEALTSMLGQTFIETLDCPGINGIRTSRDILEGFLDGDALDALPGWWLLEKADKLVGCSLVKKMQNGAAELVYLGLVPGARGRGYGKHLLDQGVLSARGLGCDMVLAAVDCDNWPAVRMYMQRGFQERGRVQAWFHQQ